MELKQITAAMLPDLLELERHVWDDDSGTETSFRTRIERFPEGSCAAYIGHKLVGMAWSALLPLHHQVNEYDEAFFPWERVHDPKGEILYLYCSTVHPAYRGQGIWKRMIDSRINYARTHAEIKKVWVDGRIEAGKYGPDTARILEQMGFTKVKHIPFKDHCDQALLQLLPPYTIK